MSRPVREEMQPPTKIYHNLYVYSTTKRSILAGGLRISTLRARTAKEYLLIAARAGLHPNLGHLLPRFKRAPAGCPTSMVGGSNSREQAFSQVTPISGEKVVYQHQLEPRKWKFKCRMDRCGGALPKIRRTELVT